MNDRKLLAIVFIDVVGFTAMANQDEENALFLLDNAVRMLKATVKRYQGRWLKQVGDGSLCSFDSAVNAVLCAQEIQRCFMMNDELKLRIGIHIGDVVVASGDIFGDGVNVASRIQNEAEPGGIVVSEEVHNALASHSHINDQLLGETFLKGVGRGLNLYQVMVNQDLPTSAVPFELQQGSGFSEVARRPISVAAFLLIMLVCIALLWVVKQVLNSNDATIKHSIAVLPFKNFSNDPTLDYYGEAISEELLNVLAKSPELHVASRTSSFDPNLRDTSFDDVVDTLQVNYIVEGSIRKTGELLRVTAQFIRASDNKHLLSTNYDLSDTRWIQQQENVSFDYVSRIGRALGIDLSVYMVKDNTTFLDSKEQQTFLRLQRQVDAAASNSDYLKAIDETEDFIEHNPNFVQGYAYLCRTYVAFYQFQSGEQRHIERARQACQQAVKNDPYDYSTKLAQGHLLLAIGEYKQGLKLASALASGFTQRAEAQFLQGDFFFAQLQLDDGIASYERGLALNSNYWRPYLNLAYNLIGLAEFRKASQYLSRYIELRPQDPLGYENLGAAMLYLGEVAAADELFSKALEMSPSYPNLSNIGTSKYFLGDYAKAIVYFQKALFIDDSDYRVWANLAQAQRQLNAKQGNEEYLQAIVRATAALRVNGNDAATLAALAYFNQAIDKFELADVYRRRATEVAEQSYESQYYLALQQLSHGNMDNALRHIEQSLALGYPAALVKSEPEFRAAIETPELQALIGD